MNKVYAKDGVAYSLTEVGMVVRRAHETRNLFIYDAAPKPAEKWH